MVDFLNTKRITNQKFQLTTRQTTLAVFLKRLITAISTVSTQNQKRLVDFQAFSKKFTPQQYHRKLSDTVLKKKSPTVHNFSNIELKCQ